MSRKLSKHQFDLVRTGLLRSRVNPGTSSGTARQFFGQLRFSLQFLSVSREVIDPQRQRPPQPYYLYKWYVGATPAPANSGIVHSQVFPRCWISVVRTGGHSWYYGGAEPAPANHSTGCTKMEFLQGGPL